MEENALCSAPFEAGRSDAMSCAKARENRAHFARKSGKPASSRSRKQAHHERNRRRSEEARAARMLAREDSDYTADITRQQRDAIVEANVRRLRAEGRNRTADEYLERLAEDERLSEAHDEAPAYLEEEM